jgi:uncharacterized lipoprotein YddW (UPF0748 family)
MEPHMRLTSLLLAALSVPLISLFPTSAILAAPPEVRGTWITTTANDAISSPARTEETMRRLREIGLNTVYVECWKNGYTEFPSETMKRTVGIAMRVNGQDAIQRDLLAESVIQAHRNGLLCVAWFEYGFMAAFKDTTNELRAKKEWMTVAADGSDIGKKNGFAWLNPFHPEVQQFLIDISLDAIKAYDLDGIQLDDRIALPVDLGYDDYTRALYKKETGKDVPSDFKDPAWMQWRADKITDFSLRYVTELRAARPELIISVSPAPFPWSYENYLCDWMQWTRWCYCGGKRWNEYVPQTYRMDGPATIKSIQEQIDLIGDEKVSLVPGIRVVGDGPDLKFDDLKNVIEFTRKQELAGHVLWFSRGVLDLYPNELKQFYDVENKGAASNPFKAGDWRPLPIVATRGEGNAWKANVKQAGRYRVIAKASGSSSEAKGSSTAASGSSSEASGSWSEVSTLDLKVGEHTIVQDAEALELLIDRRP